MPWPDKEPTPAIYSAEVRARLARAEAEDAQRSAQTPTPPPSKPGQTGSPTAACQPFAAKTAPPNGPSVTTAPTPPPAHPPGSLPWLQQHGNAPFPIDLLPGWIGDYIRCLAARFLLHPDALAPIVLAQLAGVVAEHRPARSPSGAPIKLPFSIIVATTETPTLSMAQTEITRTLTALQQPYLDDAVSFDRKRAQDLMEKPRAALPTDALPGLDGVAAGDMDKWRARYVRLCQHPVFWLETPGSKELRAGFDAAFDRTLLVSFSRGGWLERLVAPKRDREANRLGELLMRLVQQGHVSLPPSPRHPGAPLLIQAHLGLAGLTTSATLAQALTDGREDVRALLANSVLLDLPQASSAAAAGPAAHQLHQVGTMWKEKLSTLLEARRSADCRCLEPDDCFYRVLGGWPAHLHAIGAQLPASLHGHLAAFADLPLKLGCLLLTVGPYGVWKDADAAKAAIRLTAWLLVRTMLCALAAQEARRQRMLGDAREVMLAKIVEHGPIPFWLLCRRFDKQRKALHEPTLQALLDEKRVRLDEAGKLVAV